MSADFRSTWPFERGHTFFEGQVAANRVSDLQDDWLGAERLMQDKHAASKRHARLLIVKNNSGYALNPREALVWSSVAGERGRVVAGRTSSANQRVAGWVDPYYAVTGKTIANHDVFYMLVEGPGYVNIDSTGAVVAGDILITSATDQGKMDEASAETDANIVAVCDAAADASSTCAAIVKASL